MSKHPYHCSNDKGWVLARPKAGVRNLTQVSNNSGRKWITWASPLPSPLPLVICISRRLDSEPGVQPRPCGNEAWVPNQCLNCWDKHLTSLLNFSIPLINLFHFRKCNGCLVRHRWYLISTLGTRLLWKWMLSLPLSCYVTKIFPHL